MGYLKYYINALIYNMPTYTVKNATNEQTLSELKEIS
jgi:hypothetical protein